MFLNKNRQIFFYFFILYGLSAQVKEKESRSSFFGLIKFDSDSKYEDGYWINKWFFAREFASPVNLIPIEIRYGFGVNGKSTGSSSSLSSDSFKDDPKKIRYESDVTPLSQGVKNILKIGINVGLISGRDSPATRKRAEELGIRTLMLGVEDKFKSFNKWKRESQIDEKNCGHMGDDLPDLKLLQMVNLAVAVPDAVPEVKESADYITVKKGGKGAVRELCDLITKYYE